MPASKQMIALMQSASSAKARSGFMSPVNAGLRYYNRYLISRLNRDTVGLEGATVQHIYSLRSRVIRPYKGNPAVKLSDGRKGWVINGVFVEQTQSRASATVSSHVSNKGRVQTEPAELTPLEMESFFMGIGGDDDFRRLLKSIDSTIPGVGQSYKLLDIYDNLGPEQQAQFRYMMNLVDWDVFWDMMYREDGSQDIDSATRAYINLIRMIQNVMGWELM